MVEFLDAQSQPKRRNARLELATRGKTLAWTDQKHLPWLAEESFFAHIHTAPFPIFRGEEEDDRGNESGQGRWEDH